MSSVPQQEQQMVFQQQPYEQLQEQHQLMFQLEHQHLQPSESQTPVMLSTAPLSQHVKHHIVMQTSPAVLAAAGLPAHSAGEGMVSAAVCEAQMRRLEEMVARKRDMQLHLEGRLRQQWEREQEQQRQREEHWQQPLLQQQNQESERQRQVFQAIRNLLLSKPSLTSC